MRKVRTISVSLEPEYLEILKKVSHEKGSTSAAIRHLLRGHQEREWEEAYREYYSDPKNVKADLQVTRELHALAGLTKEPRHDHGRRKRRSSR